MNLSIGKLILALKKMCDKTFLVFLFCVFLISYIDMGLFSYANAPVISETPNINIFEQYERYLESLKNPIVNPGYYVDTTSIEEQLKILNAMKNLTPLDLQHYNSYYHEVYSDKTTTTFNEVDKQILINYYNADLALTGDLTKYHEENYIYTDGHTEKSIYNGIIGYYIEDFDNDTKPELAIFKIRTDTLYDNNIKEVYVDVIKLQNGLPYLLDRMILIREEFSAETIELDISFKKYNDARRLYINYFERKVADNSVLNRFMALDIADKVYVVSEANYAALADIYYHYDENYDFTNIVVDAGIEVKDDDDIINHAFINNDPKVHPITTLYRVNESLKDGYLENYMENYYDDFLKYGFLKIRYGYTNIMMR